VTYLGSLSGRLIDKILHNIEWLTPGNFTLLVLGHIEAPRRVLNWVKRPDPPRMVHRTCVSSTMDASTQKYTYEDIVKRTKEGKPTFVPLYKFLLGGDNKLDCKITLVEFEDDNPKLDEPKEEKRIEPRKIEKSALENELKKLEQTDGHRLLLVENLTPNVITLLGEHWKVPPDFFLAHLENSNWYNLLNIPQNLPSLSSVQSLDRYVRLQFIGPREFEIADAPDPQPPGNLTIVSNYIGSY
jgi:hypothetical protein